MRNAQLGLLAEGGFKFLSAVILIVPGIALAGITRDHPLADPDRAFVTMVTTLLPSGVRGLILCGLFASLMTMVNSILHSVSTLWSVDIYKRHLRKDATDHEMVRTGRIAVVVTFVVGTLCAFVQVFIKASRPEFPFTHWFNEITYYAKNGLVVLIVSAIFLINADRRRVLFAVLFSVPATLAVKFALPHTNYYLRTIVVIVAMLTTVAVPTIARNGWRIPLRDLVTMADGNVRRAAIALACALALTHLIFH